jgi:predicted amidohydrolase
MALQGAAALFVPTNNGLPPTKAGRELVAETRNVDIARAIENGVSVIRADVAGRAESLISHGSTEIVDHEGMVIQAARQDVADLIVADINAAPSFPSCSTANRAGDRADGQAMKIDSDRAAAKCKSDRPAK